jgi:hypothetical protein
MPAMIQATVRDDSATSVRTASKSARAPEPARSAKLPASPPPPAEVIACAIASACSAETPRAASVPSTRATFCPMKIEP